MTKVGGIAADKLRQYIERIEQLEEGKRGLASDISGIYADAKVDGFDPKIMRKCVALRRMHKDEQAAMEAMIDTYMHALEFDTTPLGAASK